MIEVELPDGRVVEIETDDPNVAAEAARKFMAQPNRGDLSTGQKAFRGAEMASRGFTDSALETVAALPEATAWLLRSLGVPSPEPGTYERGLKGGFNAIAEAMSQPFQEEIAALGPLEPQTSVERGMYGLGRGAADAASILLPAAAVSRGAKAGSLTQGVAKNLAAQPGLQVTAGMAGGAVGEATDNPYLGTAAALAVPAAASVAGGIRGALDNYLSARDVMRNAPTTDALRQASTEAANRARASGVVVKPESFQGFLQSVTDDVGEQLDDVLHPDLARALSKLNTRAENQASLQQLMNARTMVGDIRMSPKAAERRLAGKVLERLDDYIGNLSADDLAAGDGSDVGKHLADMRKSWSRLRKTELIEEAFEKAKNQASGFENGIRTQFRAILNNKNKSRGFSEEELDAMREVVRGTPSRNAMRLLGKFGFDFKQNTNAVGAALGGAAGYAIDPLGSLIVPAVGSAARYGAGRGTERAAELARALAATGASTRNPATASQNLLTGPLFGILAARGKEPAVQGLLEP